MGTVFTIAVRDPGTWHDAIADVVHWLHRVDRVFSTYKPFSDISRLRRGEVLVEHTDPLVGEVLALCDRYEHETDGFFTAHLPGGLDPSGLVKGWAIERASELLRSRGSSNHAVNGGGDMQLAGESAPSTPWRVGISDPHDRSKVLTVVTGCDVAVATSGTAERGDHVVDPHTGAPVSALASATVVGPSLTAADVYATAALAMGPSALGWLEALPHHEGLIVTSDGTIATTTGFPSASSPHVP